MFTVRELAELCRRLDEATFAQQMGPFALMQRPQAALHVEDPLHDRSLKETRTQPSVKLRPLPSSVDFGDLLVATLPPPQPDDSMKLLIGRSPDCDLVVTDASVSKHHAEVRWDGQRAVLEELGSANGTFVNDRRMKDRWTLRDGDQLAFGHSYFLFLWSPSLHRRLRGLAQPRGPQRR